MRDDIRVGDTVSNKHTGELGLVQRMDNIYLYVTLLNDNNPKPFREHKWRRGEVE